MKSKKKGCAFEIKDGLKSRYFISLSVDGLENFARCLYENRTGAAGEPLPVWQRIPQVEELSATAWLALADDLEAASQFACNLIVEACTDVFWVNEDIGDGMEYFMFSFSAVIEAAAAGTHDLWARLLAQYPSAKKG